MRPPSALALLEVWELGAAEPPFRRSMRLLRAACPEIELEALLTLDVGRRDELLLRLRRQLFGPRLVCLVECPVCGDRLELDVEIDMLLTAAQPDGGAVLSFHVEDIEINFRQPTTLDLDALITMEERSDGRRFLLRRCIVEAHRENASVSFEELPPSALDGLEEEMAGRAALADIYLDTHCLVCGHRWEAAFDVGSFLWSELDVWARRLLNEVHLLASAYGWGEADILRLSPVRRRSYLQMVRQ
jgi:hypothetical protein